MKNQGGMGSALSSLQGIGQAQGNIPPRIPTVTDLLDSVSNYLNSIEAQISMLETKAGAGVSIQSKDAASEIFVESLLSYASRLRSQAESLNSRLGTVLEVL